jgi:hypothetical protein
MIQGRSASLKTTPAPITQEQPRPPDQAHALHPSPRRTINIDFEGPHQPETGQRL